MEWIIRRLKEPSSWRGIVVLLSIAGVTLSAELQEQIIVVGSAAIALIEIIRKERHHDTGQGTGNNQTVQGGSRADTGLPEAAGDNP